MPQLQIVNTTRDKPDPTGVEEFFSRIGKDYKDKQDRDVIGNLLQDYEKNKEDINSLDKFETELFKSTVGPTKRLESQELIKNLRQSAIQKDKQITEYFNRQENETKEKSSQQDKINKQLKIDEEKKLKQEQDVKEKQEKSNSTANEVEEILMSGGEDPKEAKRLSRILSPASAGSRIREMSANKKISNTKEEKLKEEEKSKEVTQKAFNEIAQLIPKAGVGTSALSVFGGENAKTLGKFSSLTGALEALLVEKVNRGALSNTRFEYITKTLLPKATDTQAEIRGKMEGLAVILELDPSELQNLDKKKPKKKEQKSTESKVPEGKVRVMIKGSNPPQYGSVTPYPGMESKYDIINE